MAEKLLSIKLNIKLPMKEDLNTNNINLMNAIISDNRNVINGILGRCITKMDKSHPITIDINVLTNEILELVGDNMTYDQMYCFMADYCAGKSSYHPNYIKFASFICIDRLHQITESDYIEIVKLLYDNSNNKKNKSIISKEYYENVLKHHKRIQNALDYERDYQLDYFGIRTLERSYLANIKNSHDTTNVRIVERPQHLFMRTALHIHRDDIEKAIETYNLMSQKYFIHATPTLFNSGAPKSQGSSCFLLSMKDSIDDIFDTIKQCAKVSQYSGGIGIDISRIRASGSIIYGTNGISNGLIPLCRVINSVATFVNQGGKRNGSIAVYLEPWHADIYDFCEMRRNNKSEEMKARDLFLALWIPDIFMKRVEENGIWSLMCPDECPNLTETYGSEFEKLYISYEEQGKYKKQVNARKLWFHIMDSQIETGMPYMLYKDSINKKSNQSNIGIIRSSNLCSEIVEVVNDGEIAVCNLASIPLSTYVENKIFNFEKLLQVVKVITVNLNKLIDNNYYPVDEAKVSNLRHRPIGIGIQGLADTYNKMGYSFGSEESNILNKKIFETIYYGSLQSSNEIAIMKGSPYSTFEGSPFSKGLLQFHLWNKNESDLLMNYDWTNLIESIKKHGTMNSLLTALMPTASTSQIMGNCESFEPYLSNIFTRTTLAGEFMVVNQHLVNDLIKLNLWSDEMRNKIIIYNGSIQKINEIPDNIKEIYKTAFEIKQKHIVQQAIDRGCFIDQTQSMNLFIDKPDYEKLTSSHFYGWKHGLKTGMYYLRSQPATNPIKFGVDIDLINKVLHNNIDDINHSNNIKNVKSNILYRKKKNNENKNSNGRVHNECEMCSS